MTLQAYINFSGNCREAVEYYADVFKTEKPNIMLFGDAPTSSGFSPDEASKNLVMHAELKINNSSIMFSDVPPGMPLVVGNNISLVIGIKDIDEMKSIFNKLKQGGFVVMELQETFFSKYYGFVRDKFGIGWQLSLG